MSFWHRPVKSHVLSRARPRWKNTQSIFLKIYHISSLSCSFFKFFSLFFHPPGMNVSAKNSDFAGVFQPLQVKAQWSSVTSVKWSPMDLVLAGGTSNVNNKHLQRKDFQTLRGKFLLGRISTGGPHGYGSPWFSEMVFCLADLWFQQGFD